jgi:CTD small phosphatase-like protein 2
MINVILDLDETLIHTTEITQQYSPILAKEVDFYFKLDGNYYWVLKRPGLKLFLEFMFKYFNVGIWTAADKSYCTEICKNILDKKQLKKIKFIHSRQFCMLDMNNKPPIFTKPLTRVFELYPSFKPENSFIIDNTYNVMRYNLQNAVLIPDFINNPNDQYLYHIRNILVKYYAQVPMNNPVWVLVHQLNKYLSIL